MWPARLELGHSTLEHLETLARPLEYSGLRGELVTRDEIEAGKLGAQDGAELRLEVFAHSPCCRWQGFEKSSSQIIDANRHGRSSHHFPV